MRNERGMAMIAALMVLLLMSALMIGFTTIVTSDGRFRGIDKERTRAYYGAQSGLEKLTVDLGNLFLTKVAPTAGDIAALSNNPPVIPDLTYVAPAGVTAYGITQVACNPQGQMNCNGQIQSGSYQGLLALKRMYRLDAVAKTTNLGEAHLSRIVESVAIPVFQFGIFSDVDLSFFAGPNFNFGGRVHTNGNLFLSEGNGSTLTLTDKVTAVKEIVRQRLQNGVSIDAPSAHAGTVNMATATNVFRPLDRTEGSVNDGLTPIDPNTNWNTISLSYYNGYIRNGASGAKALNLPLITIGGANTALVRRPPPGELANDPTLYGERLYSKVSLRIMLSDTANDMSNLPTVTPIAPVQLDGNWNLAPPNNGVVYGPISGARPPIARSAGVQTITTAAATAAGDNFVRINMPVVGNFYHLPVWPQTITWGANNLQINCQAVNPAIAPLPPQFVNCTVNGGGNFPNIPAGATMTSPLIDGVTVNIQTTNSVGAGLPAMFTFNVNTTVPFAANTFWMQDRITLIWNPVTCLGWTNNPNNRLTNCTGVPVTNAGANVITTGALQARDSGTIGGFIKIDMQLADLTWRDVTMEILNYGIGAPNQAGAACGDPTPNAILRIQRLRDNGGTCHYANSTIASDYWPQTLFDTREALLRDVVPVDINNNLIKDLNMGGVMHYIALDVRNLTRWFQGAGAYAGGSGNQAFNTGGYSVYFSDRRNNRDANSQETGEYGFEDFVNPGTNGVPNAALDTGEDLNGNNAVDVYGEFPNYNGVANALPPGAVAPYNAAARPWIAINKPGAMSNRAILFRHALKLINGGLGNIIPSGFTVVTENPVYVQGDWNTSQAGFANNDGHVATSVIADAVTLLSNEWTDINSFVNPYCVAGTTNAPCAAANNRNRGTPAFYRLAIIGGKGIPFPQPAGTATDFGTDGGAHNFLRYLENGNQAVNYRGSIATFFYNRQAVGTFKCCATVYGAPARNYSFDTDFLNPATLPPLTPVFRDLNALGFSQEMRPGK